MIDAAFNVANIRSNTLFCTGKITSASVYGDVYEIYPTGDVKFIWSPILSDSYIQLDKIYEALTAKINEKCNTEFTPKFTKLNIFYDIHKLVPNKSSEWVHDKSNDNTINSYMWNTKGNKPFNFANVIKQSLREVGLELYRNDSLPEAIDSNNEILIYQSGGYFVGKKVK
jgi:hypothetical protein